MSETIDTGPFLSTAIICQQATFDEGGALVGVSEITRHVQVDGKGPEAAEEMPELEVKLKAVAVLVAGEGGRGKAYTIAIQPQTPAGKRLRRADFPFEFVDHEQAIATMTIDLNLQLDQVGLYWVDLILAPRSTESERLLTRIPLEVSYHRSES